MSTMDVQADIDTLFDFLARHRTGVTLKGIMRHTGWTQRKASNRINRLRAMFGEDRENLICAPGKAGWMYRLTSDAEEARPWVVFNQRYMVSRLDTVLSVAKSMEAATSESTIEGKKARMAVRGLTRLIEDLADVGA